MGYGSAPGCFQAHLSSHHCLTQSNDIGNCLEEFENTTGRGQMFVASGTALHMRIMEISFFRKAAFENMLLQLFMDSYFTYQNQLYEYHRWLGI